jgi:hypothetical protein
LHQSKIIVYAEDRINMVAYYITIAICTAIGSVAAIYVAAAMP